MSNFSNLQQQVNDAEAKVNELRKQLEAELKTERTHAIAAARELIRSHGMTAMELGLSAKGNGKGATGDKRNVVAPKYQDPDSGKTWTGRGKSPSWLSAYLASGREKQEFLIKV